MFLMAPVAIAAPSGAHRFSFDGIEGGQIDLGAFSGHPILVVNTASLCGFTYQYDGLQALYDRFRERGFVLVGVPSDDFGGQELSSEADVKDFCEVNFSIDFPMTAITHVRGAEKHPFYDWAEAMLGAQSAPTWNFHKYLIEPDGALAGAWSHRSEPEDPSIVSAIEAILAR